APPPLTPEELAFNKERAASEENDPLYPYKIYNDNDGWEWAHSERDYTDMEPNILKFPKPDILQVSYGQDTFRKRAKKRTFKTWNLKKLFAKPGIMTLMECDYEPAGSVNYQRGIGFENCAYVNDKEEAGIFDGHLKNMNFGNSGLASVILKNGQAVQAAYVNREGKTARVHYFDNGADHFVEGLARTVKDGKLGFINEKLNIVISPQYDFAFPFSNSAALVCNGCKFVAEGEHTSVVGGKWGYINKGGVVIVPIQHEKDKLPNPPVREPDAKPVEIHLSLPIPAGKAYAYFDIYTGGDQMAYKKIKTRPLILVVRFDDKELRQTIANCEDVSHGTAAGGGTKTELEVAECDADRYWLITEKGKVLVQKGEWDKRDNIVAEISLPHGITNAVMPK
ncbi:MAG: WG repeat-containing protein, partial [Nitrospirae bacterium]|nr:WG repeat-containing protein [Nitrospirota bacterium]